jgi:hypothetical protein
MCLSDYFALRPNHAPLSAPLSARLSAPLSDLSAPPVDMPPATSTDVMPATTCTAPTVADQCQTAALLPPALPPVESTVNAAVMKLTGELTGAVEVPHSPLDTAAVKPTNSSTPPISMWRTRVHFLDARITALAKNYERPQEAEKKPWERQKRSRDI